MQAGRKDFFCFSSGHAIQWNAWSSDQRTSILLWQSDIRRFDEDGWIQISLQIWAECLYLLNNPEDLYNQSHDEGRINQCNSVRFHDSVCFVKCCWFSECNHSRSEYCQCRRQRNRESTLIWRCISYAFKIQFHLEKETRERVHFIGHKYHHKLFRGILHAVHAEQPHFKSADFHLTLLCNWDLYR